MDTYGQGGVVADLEAEISRLLGKAAAVYLPSGAMAQQAVLRVHADARGRRTVVFHPMCHLEQHEEQAHERLHGLIGRPAGGRERLITLADLTDIAEAPAALLLELPQRDLGGQQPEWDDLVAQVGWARERGAAAHLDGARLWESAAGYEKSPAEISALFDTVYVSFYKGIGALAWLLCRRTGRRHRRGPGMATADGRRTVRAMAGRRIGAELPRRAAAKSFPLTLTTRGRLPAALAAVPGVTVIPDPPQVPMMHLLLRADRDEYASAARQLAEDSRIWTSPEPIVTADPGVQRLELSVGDGTLGFTAEEIAGIFAGLTGS